MSNAGQQLVEGHDRLSLLLHQPLAFPYSSRLPLLQLALPDSGDFCFAISRQQPAASTPSSDESTSAFCADNDR